MSFIYRQSHHSTIVHITIGISYWHYGSYIAICGVNIAPHSEIKRTPTCKSCIRMVATEARKHQGNQKKYSMRVLSQQDIENMKIREKE